MALEQLARPAEVARVERMKEWLACPTHQILSFLVAPVMVAQEARPIRPIQQELPARKVAIQGCPMRLKSSAQVEYWLADRVLHRQGSSSRSLSEQDCQKAKVALAASA